MRACSILLTAAALAGSLAIGQSQAAKPWTPRHTPVGQPDIQGIWTNASLTALERPAALAGKNFLTEKELAEYRAQLLKQFDRDDRGGGAQADLARAYGGVWWDAGVELPVNYRTSLIVDPPDGRIPALTAAVQDRLAVSRAAARDHPADGPENRSVSERCMVWPTAGLPMIPSFSNNHAPYGPMVSNYIISQIPGYVVLFAEIVHDARVIPLDGRSHLPGNIRQWLGDSRGHWEGNTLAVDTTNFTGKTGFKGSSENLHLTERFTPTGPDTMMYEFTVDDPTAFTRPWSAQIPMTRSKGPIVEFACNEGNYGMSGIRAGARAQEKAEAAKSSR
jgi:hypothetical protein